MDQKPRFTRRYLEPVQPRHAGANSDAKGSRSLNLANAVAVIMYEAWRQMGFPGGDDIGQGWLAAARRERMIGLQRVDRPLRFTTPPAEHAHGDLLLSHIDDE